jgi:sugar phosphate isomerase/epimerase
MLLTTITDEVCENADLYEIFDKAAELGIRNFEIRSVGGRRFPNIEASDLAKLKDCVKRRNITFSAVSPGIFKGSLHDEAFRFHKETLLERSLELAQELEVKKLIIFSIKRGMKRTSRNYSQVVDEIGVVTHKASKRGIMTLVENEPGYWADTSSNCLKLIQDISDVNLGLNWDPGNLFMAGEMDYRPGYERLKKYIGNVHIKDAKSSPAGIQYVAVGDGDIDYAGQLKSLKEDRYEGCITMETHCLPLYDNFQKSTRYISKLLSECC